MKLVELQVKGKERYDYSDVSYSLSIRGRDLPDVTVPTNLPNVTLDVHEYGSKYVVLIKDAKVKVGFIDFVRPDAVNSKGFEFNRKTWTPHSGIRLSHTGRGYVSAVYRWFLDAGNNLVTGHEQTLSSNMLWRSLSRHYPIVFFDNTTGKQIKNPTPEEATANTTRMALLGKGNTRISDLWE